MGYGTFAALDDETAHPVHCRHVRYTHCSLPTTHYPLSTTRYSLETTGYPLPAGPRELQDRMDHGQDLRYPLPTAHCPLPTTHCSLLTTHYPLPTTHYPLLPGIHARGAAQTGVLRKTCVFTHCSLTYYLDE